MDVKGNGRAYFEVVLQYVSRVAKENHEKLSLACFTD
jgi:hypothetical protein